MFTREPCLTQTRRLLEQYGEKITSNSLTDEELEKLLNTNQIFKKSASYPDATQAVTDDNFSVMDGIIDFVLAITPTLSQDRLHDLVERAILTFLSKENAYRFLRTSTLDKYLLIYEKSKYPARADKHFSDEDSPVKQKLEEKIESSNKNETINGMKNFLNDLTRLFTSPEQQDRFRHSTTAANPATMFFKNETNIYKISLSAFIKHYSPIAEAHEKLMGRNIMRSGQQRVAIKRAIGQELLSHLQRTNTLENLYNVFQTSLLNHNLTSDEFFSGKTDIFIVTRLKEKLIDETLTSTPTVYL